MRRARSAPLRNLLALAALAAPLVGAAPAGAIGDGPGESEVITSTDGWLSVDADGEGNLVVSNDTQILRVAPDNSFIEVATGLVHPFRVAADPTSDDVYFREGMRVRRARNGAVSTVVDEDELTNEPTVAVGADGTPYVADDERIRRIEDDGTLTTVATAPELILPGALAISPTGQIAVGGFSGIWRSNGGPFTLTGRGPCDQSPDPCGDGGTASDALFFARGLDFDDAGNLYVQERNRVRVVELDGTVRNVAGTWRAPAQQCTTAFCRRGVATQLELDPRDIATVGEDLAIVTGPVGQLVRVHAPLAVPETPPQGYRMVASDGGVFTFGWSTFWGSTGSVQLVSPIVAGISDGRDGYWFVAGDGGVFTFGDAGFFGSAAGATTSPVVDIARTPSGNGYWVLERNGRVHALGDAPHRGDGLPTAINVTIIGARTGNGYRIVRSDGAQDDRQDQIGGPPATFPRLNSPIVHARPTPSGNGLWLVAADGGVFTQGDAGFFGSTGAMRLNQPVVDLVPTPTGNGYWLIARDGGVFTFGDAVFMGSMGGVTLNRPVVAGVAGPQVSG